MGIARAARALEGSINRRSVVYLRRRGWVPRIVGLSGYGSHRSLHVFGRVIMADPDGPDFFDDLEDDHARMPTRPAEVAAEAQRGWRSFFTAQVGYLPVIVHAGGQSIRTTTDRSGYIDVLVRDHGLEPGWQEVQIEALAARPVTAKVLVVDPAVRTGIVSDIDDTIVVTMLPRVFIAAWNTFVRFTSARNAVPGMASLYQRLLEEEDGAPIFYLSTGAWNTVPTLRRFMRQHGYPEGPMLMTNWGPTPTGLFRSGVEHKRVQLRNLMITFPEIRWVLVGDDGQHDPMVYDEIAREHPRKVTAVAIRELTPTEQVLAHGTPEAIEQPPAIRNASAEHGVPTVRGRDGYALATLLPEVVDERHAAEERRLTN
ncbi:App1 family protein [Bogoriella caseilytica]|uniref:Phosphatidate phosphatase APP1 n=1 Tax=Bogoriella caseilytica TaxID=56055 RepID=A0A3N2BCV4_9MICO|nr:phosphatase domain-containing protein [Bogoriella caseilytica]ROR73083.1 phosphatidate phosphatase APP1 [Bogoriella caseilytica]